MTYPADPKRTEWTAERVGNMANVTEIHRDRFGSVTDRIHWRVPAEYVPVFLDARKRIVQFMILRPQRSVELPGQLDFDFLEDSNDRT